MLSWKIGAVTFTRVVEMEVAIPHETILGDSIQLLFDAGSVDLVCMDHRLSPEIALTPMPGHTPGHVSVSIVSEGKHALIIGDALHHPCQMARPDWSPPFDSDRAMSEATWRAVLEDAADRPLLVIGAHYATPTAGHVVRDGNSFRFERGRAQYPCPVTDCRP